MAEEKGLKKPVKLKKDLSSLLGETELPRMEITSKMWVYIKDRKLQSKVKNGKPTGEGKFIVADKALLAVFKNTNVVNKKGAATDLREMKEGETIDMMQLATIVGANIE